MNALLFGVEERKCRQTLMGNVLSWLLTLQRFLVEMRLLLGLMAVVTNRLPGLVHSFEGYPDNAVAASTEAVEGGGGGF